MTIKAYISVVASIGIMPMIFLKHMVKLVNQLYIIFIVVAIVLPCTVLPFLCYTVGLKLVDVGKAVIIVMVGPIVVTFIGILVYRENLTALKSMGMILIVSALVLLFI